MKHHARPIRGLIPALAGALMLAGCAGDTPRPVTVQAFENPEQPLEGYSHVIVTCEAMQGVDMPEREQQRVASMVKRELESRAPGRFVFPKPEEESKGTAPTSEQPDMKEPKTAVMKILFIEYDEGSAFARLMIAGAGQIRIDTDVTLRDKATYELLGQYEVSKQFALGGIYGGTTDVEDVEEGLAKGIAEILVPEAPSPEPEPS